MVLICSLATVPDMADCNEKTATAIVRVPVEFKDAYTCLMESQFYAAASNMVGEGEQIRIVCKPDLIEQTLE